MQCRCPFFPPLTDSLPSPLGGPEATSGRPGTQVRMRSLCVLSVSQNLVGSRSCSVGSSEVLKVGSICGRNQALPLLEGHMGQGFGGCGLIAACLCPLPGIGPLSTWRARRVEADTELTPPCARSIVFCLGPRSLISSASTYETVAGDLVSLQVG